MQLDTLVNGYTSEFYPNGAYTVYEKQDKWVIIIHDAKYNHENYWYTSTQS